MEPPVWWQGFGPWSPNTLNTIQGTECLLNSPSNVCSFTLALQYFCVAAPPSPSSPLGLPLFLKTAIFPLPRPTFLCYASTLLPWCIDLTLLEHVSVSTHLFESPTGLWVPWRWALYQKTLGNNGWINSFTFPVLAFCSSTWSVHSRHKS